MMDNSDLHKKRDPFNDIPEEVFEVFSKTQETIDLLGAIGNTLEKFFSRARKVLKIEEDDRLGMAAIHMLAFGHLLDKAADHPPLDVIQILFGVSIPSEDHSFMLSLKKVSETFKCHPEVAYNSLKKETIVRFNMVDSVRASLLAVGIDLSDSFNNFVKYVKRLPKSRYSFMSLFGRDPVYALFEHLPPRLVNRTDVKYLLSKRS